MDCVTLGAVVISLRPLGTGAGYLSNLDALILQFGVQLVALVAYDPYYKHVGLDSRSSRTSWTSGLVATIWKSNVRRFDTARTNLHGHVVFAWAQPVQPSVIDKVLGQDESTTANQRGPSKDSSECHLSFSCIWIHHRSIVSPVGGMSGRFEGGCRGSRGVGSCCRPAIWCRGGELVLLTMTAMLARACRLSNHFMKPDVMS